MSVIIKDFKIPKHCIDCPFMVSRDNDDCVLQSEEANASAANWEEMKAGCPLVDAGDEIKPITRAHWIEHKKGFWSYVNGEGKRDGWTPDYECSNCGSRAWNAIEVVNMFWCPVCGALMSEKGSAEP